jgi:hypothetical protein
MNRTAPKHLKKALGSSSAAIALTLLVLMLTPSWAESDLAQSRSDLASTPMVASNAWHCRQLDARALGHRLAEGRRLLRAARATGACEHVRRHYELCEPARVHWSPSSNAVATKDTRALSARLCVIGECSEPGADAAKIALQDAFGRRGVTAAGIDRLCVDLD